MTETDIRKKASEAGLSAETAESMVRSSHFADRLRKQIAARAIETRGFRVESVYGVDGTPIGYRVVG